MSETDDNRVFYFIKLPCDFFDDKVMKRLRKLPGGEIYTIIALKILLMGVREENVIYFDGLCEDFSEEIAMSIDEDIEAVKITLSYLIQCGWLEYKSCDEIYSPKGAEMSGKISARGLRKQRQSERKKLLEEQSSDRDRDRDRVEEEKDSTISGTVPVDSETVNNKKIKDDSTIDYSFYQEKWNEICLSLPKCTLMSDKRRKAVRACLSVFSSEQVLEAMRKVQDSDFLSGRSAAWNGCGFDWLFITGNMTKVLEGNYDNRNRAGHPDMSSSTDYSKSVMEINVDE